MKKTESLSLLPAIGAWVTLKSDRQRTGIVKALDLETEPPRVRVQWIQPRNSLDWHTPDQLGNGFQLGMDVQDVPRSRVRRSLGEGKVLETRTLGGREQVLVEFPASGQRSWLPFQNLKQIKGIEHRFQVPRPPQTGDAERLRLRCLAYALELWNENTGALSHFDIDPLPHQIHLVHHILASGNLNWLIADDVGLGKTIEVGLLLAALRQRGLLRRVLLITPAGLTRQWQEEMHYKFGLSEFEIYGLDFNITYQRQWKQHDFVIGSIDRFKSEQHKASLLQTEPWDLIVFDEAHRLSRRQYGQKLDASQRFELAAELRNYTDALLLLSATPHQGMADKFQALLELLRPELKREISLLSLNPDLLKDMVFRNHKADVTDANGNFIFKGKLTKAIKVPLGEEAVAFDKALQTYLQRGYNAGKTKGHQGIAIGFVMTTYRKLAASSVAAILAALYRRLQRLHQEVQNMIETGDDETDSRFQGENEERQLQLFTPVAEFFEGELSLLHELISKAEELYKNDQKMAALLDTLLNSVLQSNPDEKVLVFTEYRATQDAIATALVERFGIDKVELINGSQKLEERAAAITRFEDEGQFLISTEAGGEGINLQRRCHIMINFDLPWNPMRLVQRIGRLYRYGQDKPVIVFNIHAPQTLDAKIMNLMYERIAQVVTDLAGLTDEFKPGLEDDILGELSDLLDVEEILAEATSIGIQRTNQRIQEALDRAREATRKQRDLFSFVASYDPNETRTELKLSSGHLRSFVEGMFRQLGIKIIHTTHGGLVWEIQLPPEVLQELSGFRTRLQVTLDREKAASRPNLHCMDLTSPLIKLLLRKAKSYNFGGQTAPLSHLQGKALFAAILRWQNDQGRRMRQEFTALQVTNHGQVITNAPAFAEWLLNPAEDGTTPLLSQGIAKTLLNAATQTSDQRLNDVSNTNLHPENRQWLAGGWL